jgi:glycosyltransferase involved in cell wall biosynthesis
MDDIRELKIAAVTGGVRTPSARFRIRQYIDKLVEYDITVEEHLPYFEKSCGLPSPFKAAARIPALFRSRDADVIWLNKELVKGYPTFERLLNRPRVLDVDDAIWRSKPLGRLVGRCIASAMDAIIAGNTYLANYFEKYNRNIHIVPTAIDCDRYLPKKWDDNENQKFVIGWTGLSCNYKQLEIIVPALKKFMADHDDVELLLVSNKPWIHEEIPARKIRYVKWTPDNEAAILHEMTVGIMPLIDTNWTRGKCSFKMLQYMASGLPVMASPVGMNADVFSHGDIGFSVESTDQWYQAFETLYKSRQRQVELGQNGRAVVRQYYSTEIMAEKLADIFRSLC